MAAQPGRSPVGRPTQHRASPQRQGRRPVPVNGRPAERRATEERSQLPERGEDLLLIASNAGADNDPAWWLNLQANPEATVEIGGVARDVRGRRASDQEEAEGWERFVAASAQYAEYRSATSRPFPIIVLEPRQ